MYVLSVKVMLQQKGKTSANTFSVLFPNRFELRNRKPSHI